MRPDIELDEKTHRYYVSGQILPSVSEILGVLENPYGSIPQYVLEHKAKVGKALHKILEGSWRIPIDMPEKDKRKAKALAEWVAENQPEFLGREVATCSLEYGYAGTWDTLCRPRRGYYRGKSLRLDIKSSTKLYPDRHFPQLEAYEQCERECGEIVSDIRGILWLPVDRPAIIVESTDSFEDFLVILKVYRSQQERHRKIEAQRSLLAKETGR